MATTNPFGERHEVDLSAGTIHYGEAGEGEPIVFVHGFAVNGLLWAESAAALADGHRCIVADWPMGSHPEAMLPGADVSVGGVVALIDEFLSALDLDDVTIVGNDSGGAVSQILVTTRPERIARLVLTNCDCFEKFPPGPFKAIAKAMKVPGAGAALAASMRIKANRHSPLAYGALTAGPIDDGLTVAWTEPQIRDKGVRRDGAAFFTSADPSMTMAAADKLADLDMPSLLVWGDADRFFTIEDARRLAATIPGAELVEVPGGRTFLPLDDPAAVATAIGTFIAGHPVGVAALKPGRN